MEFEILVDRVNVFLDVLFWFYIVVGAIVLFGILLPALIRVFRTKKKQNSISSFRNDFIDRLFMKDTTEYVLLDKNNDDIVVVSSNPTTQNILEYSQIYTEALNRCQDTFIFMVYAINEVDFAQYEVLSKSKWFGDKAKKSTC